MENKIIQIKGITRNTDDGICPDGECMELINARLKNGSIEPIGKPILIKETKNTYKNIYYHTLAKRYIGITSDGKMYEMPEDMSNETLIDIQETVYKVEFIGYSVAAITNEGLRYFIFRQGKYKYIGDIPELPEIKIGKTFINKTFKSDTTLIHGRRASSEENKAFYNAAYGYYLKCIAELNKNTYFVHATEIRIAFKMFDGTYIKHSPIRLIYFNTNESVERNMGADRACKVTFKGREEMLYVGEHTLNGEQGNESRYEEYVWFSVIGFILSFTMENTDLSDWDDIISSIEVFATPSMIYWDDRNVNPDAEEASKLMTESSLFYKIGEFNLSGTFKWTQEDVSHDILATSTALIDDSGTHNIIIPNNSYVYNSRLHISNYMQKLFEGYDKDYIYDIGTETLGTGNITISVLVKTSSGDKFLQRIFTNVNIPKYFPSFIMYPDYRAYKISILIQYESVKKSVRYDLKPHDSLNIAYHFFNTEVGEVSGEHEVRDAVPDSIEKWEDADWTYIHLNDPEEIKNILKVSSLNSAFSFPPDQTYQFNTEIIGMQSNVVAMSQGQFGAFPLYVFTKEGIFAMQVATGGNIVYSSVSAPVTRDVCNNPDSICGLDKMVAFSTDKGLMVIDGNVTTLISEKMYGFLPSCSISSPIIPKILKVASMEDCISSVVFPDYLENSKVGYNYEANEIIVSNKEYSYSYVYSIQTGEWHKISQKVESFVNSYPYTWALNGSQILNLNNIHRSISKIAIITRPIKLGSLKHKRILQTALRGIVKRSLSDLYLRGEPVMFRGENVDIFSDVGMYILGSNDAEHFELISKKERMEDIRDLVTKMNKSKPYKYFMICLVGGVRTDVSINYIEMVIDESFTNRLR